MAHLYNDARVALVALSFLAGLTGAGPALASTDVAEYMIPSDPGIELYVREKHPAGVQATASDRILLFVHGATYRPRRRSTCP